MIGGNRVLTAAQFEQQLGAYINATAICYW
jgi:hypothetical protein